MMHNLGWDHTKLITETIANDPLTYPPGTHWAYSNFGYCVLGRVIEQVTGQPYASYVQANILAPCGISTMQIAANKESQRAPNEVVVLRSVQRRSLQAECDTHGLARRVDRLLYRAGSVSESRGRSTRYSGSSEAGDDSNDDHARSRLPGRSGTLCSRVDGPRQWSWELVAQWQSARLNYTIMVRTATGMCWAALTNTRTQPSNEIDTALDQMMWNMVRTVPAWGA